MPYLFEKPDLSRALTARPARPESRARGRMLPLWRGAVCFFLAATFFLLGACSAGGISAGPPQNPLKTHSGNFDATASISYRELSATATITQETPQACTVAFTSPPSLEDMTFIFSQDTVDLNYKGLNFTFNPESLPGGAVAKLAAAGISRAMKDDGVSVDYTDGILSLNGMMESGEFTLKLDRESGNLLKLLVPSEDLEIEFVNFTFLD